MAIVVSLIMTSSYKMDRVALQDVYMDAVADAALNKVAYELIQSARTKTPVLYGEVSQWSFDGADVQTAVFPELGKVDINQAGQALLKALFVTGGMDQKQAVEVVTAITVRRPRANRDGLRSPSQPFLSIEEVRRLPHVSDAMFERLAPAITVHSQKHVYDPALVFSEVLTSVRGSKLTSSAPKPLRVSRYAGSWIKGQAFQVLIDIDAEGRRKHYSVIIRITLAPKKPYWVLELKQR